MEVRNVESMLHYKQDVLQTKEIVTLSRQSLATLLKDIGFKFRKEDNRRGLAQLLPNIPQKVSYYNG
ncbi:hypothetical protein Trydic_g5590 [Trypoxylus dichotomus]